MKMDIRNVGLQANGLSKVSHGFPGVALGQEKPAKLLWR